MTSPQDMVVLGRRAGQTTTPDWITLASVSSQAKDVYKILKMHLETFVGSGEDPFPAQELIAAIMKCSQGAVSRYVKELVDLGAVETKRRNVPGGGNQYKLHETPPEGYTGPTTLAEYIPLYLAAKAKAKANGGANAEPTNGSDASATNAPNVAPSRPAQRRTNAAPTNGGNDGGANGATLAPANDDAPTANVAADEHPALAPILEAAELAGMTDEDPSALRKLRSKLVPLLEAGVRPEELREAVVGNLGGAEKKIAVALAKLNDLAARAERIRNRPAPKQPGPKCDKGGAHANYPAENCTECRIEAVEAARQAAPKNTGAVFGTAFVGSRQ